MSVATSGFSRRRFLASGALAGGAFVLGFRLGGAARSAAGAEGDAAAAFAPNAFVRIDVDGTIRVVVPHSEMGQGPYTSVPMLLAEELDADWSRVRYEAAPVDDAYNHSVYGIQMTGGSTSTWSEKDRVRKAGAVARAMLVEAAAKRWNVDAKECKAAASTVEHAASGKHATYGELCADAAKLTPPDDVPLKDPQSYTIIGTPKKRLDTPEKTNGAAVFGLDVKRPGLLTALVARPPVFGGKVKSLNADKAKAVAGVRHVVEVPTGVAVVADGFWQAKQGRNALEIEWDDGDLAALDSAKQHDEYAALAEKPGAVASQDGDAAKGLDEAKQVVEATYDLPYLAHAAMEPLNCTADVTDDHCEIWVGTQFQTVDRNAAAAALGLKHEQVKLHTTMLGGGFGRRAVPDAHFVVEAVQISKAVKAPVKVMWTREDDTRGGYYRPRAYHAVRAGLDDAGKLSAWQHRIVCQSFAVGTPFESVAVKNGVDDTAVEGARENAYGVPNRIVDWQMAPGGVPTLWLRSVGHSHTAFVVETLIDELAHAAGKDPVEFRLAQLTAEEKRRRRVLEQLADRAGWSKPLAAGRGRGIAVHESFGTTVGHYLEVSLPQPGRVRVERVVCAVDCGPIVNPDTIEAQMEGGVAFGLSAALYGEITFKNGRVEQSNFHDYPVLRSIDMPPVEVHIVESTDKMGGVGEPGVPTVAPALVNALFALTGKRIRRLPLRAEDLMPGTA